MHEHDHEHEYKHEMNMNVNINTNTNMNMITDTTWMLLCHHYLSIKPNLKSAFGTNFVIIVRNGARIKYKLMYIMVYF
jgi:glutamate racemase